VLALLNDESLLVTENTINFEIAQFRASGTNT
jgi:hypothetical protein